MSRDKLCCYEAQNKAGLHSHLIFHLSGSSFQFLTLPTPSSQEKNCEWDIAMELKTSYELSHLQAMSLEQTRV